jgi:hypothetical protein
MLEGPIVETNLSLPALLAFRTLEFSAITNR